MASRRNIPTTESSDCASIFIFQVSIRFVTHLPTILNPLEFPLHGMRLIEASAGTGKTWTIAALYLRLVLGHGTKETTYGGALLPPEILVVTFTEAATQELRERIRERLTDAARCFRGQSRPDALLQTLIAACDMEQKLVYARMLQTAAEWMDEAAIYTIHGWCNRMLRQHAFDSGSLFNLELDAGDQELLNDVARDYWRGFFYPLDSTMVAAVAQLAITPEGLLNTLKDLLRETDGEWLVEDEQPIDVTQPQLPADILQAWCDWNQQANEWEDQARASWLNDKTVLEVWLREASEKRWLNGTRYPAKSFETRLVTLAAWAEHGAACDPKWLAAFGQSRFIMNKTHQDKLLQHVAFSALDALADHLQQQPAVQLQLKIHARQWIRQRYAVEKQRRARLDYDDLLTNLDNALQQPGGERLAHVIRRQYPVAMIDEFQDTDPLQYRIFSSVYRRNGVDEANGLFMIGDPKQAIYAFRGADIHTYLQARRDVAGQLYTLDCNFRSTQALVEAVNRVFNHAETYTGGAFKFNVDADSDNPLPFWPVRAKGREEYLEIDHRPAAPMTLWHWLPNSDDGSTNMQSYQQTFAEATATEIAELLTLAANGRAGFRAADDFKPLMPADIAILVRNRREAAAVRRSLNARGLRSVYLSDRESVYKTREAGDVLRWLRACAEPEQAALLRAALATVTLDLSLHELDELNRDELRWETQIEQFKALQKIWLVQGVLPMLRRMMANFTLPQRLLASDSGERVLTNLLHLSELLQSASVELDGEQALIRYLRDHIDSANPGDDESLLRLESDAGLIKVVTLHKSKGLEYPLVFMPFICSFREVSGQRNQYYRYHDEQGKLRIDLAKSDNARQQADHERLQEDLRLLYVGLTRARHACWLGIAPLKSGKTDKCQLHKSAIGYVLAGGEAIQAEVLQDKLEALRGGCARIDIKAPPLDRAISVAPRETFGELAPARRYSHQAMERWWIASYSALKVESANGERVEVNDAPDTPQQANLAEEVAGVGCALVQTRSDAEYMHQFPRGSHAGVFLHSVLEWAAKSGFECVAADAQLREQFIAPRCERRGWSHWIPGLTHWLGELLNLPLIVGGNPLIPLVAGTAISGKSADFVLIQSDLFEPVEEGGISFGQLSRRTYQAELEFWFAAERVDVRQLDALVCRHTLNALPRPALSPQQLHGMLKGFIDLVFEHQSCYFVVDYKSNRLGNQDGDYSAQNMRAAVLAERYDVQYCLYLLALHRLLKTRLGNGYDYDRHIGGALYLFLRGIHGPASGIHAEKPPKILIDSLDSLFAGRELHDAA